jgi:hypothetical protein
MMVYRTAAARMPSTAPFECVAWFVRRMILAMRTEKRMKEVNAERNWRTRRTWRIGLWVLLLGASVRVLVLL